MKKNIVKAMVGATVIMLSGAVFAGGHSASEGAQKEHHKDHHSAEKKEKYAEYKSKKMEKMAAWHMKQVDADGDGKISKQEHDAFVEKHFKSMDANGDGFIDMSELAKGAMHHAKDYHKKSHKEGAKKE